MSDKVKSLVWKLGLSAVLIGFIMYAEGRIGDGTGYASRAEVLVMEQAVEEIEEEMAELRHGTHSLRIESLQGRIFGIQNELCTIDPENHYQVRLSVVLREELSKLMNRHRELAGYSYQVDSC